MAESGRVRSGRPTRHCWFDFGMGAWFGASLAVFLMTLPKVIS